MTNSQNTVRVILGPKAKNVHIANITTALESIAIVMDASAQLGGAYANALQAAYDAVKALRKFH